MAKKKPGGGNPDQIKANIANIEAELQELSKRVGTPDFTSKDNKRFNDLNNQKSELNKQLSSQNQSPEVSVSNRSNDPFVEQRTEVLASESPVVDVGAGGQAQTAIPSPEVPPSANPPAQTQGFPSAAGLGDSGIQAAQEILPTTQPVQAPTQESIVEKMLGGIDKQGGGIGQEITKSVFGGQGQPSQQPHTAEVNLQDITQGINTPLQQGTVTGSFIGSQPLFVAPPKFSPTHIIARRERELQDAAAKRKEEAQALVMRKPPLTDDTRFQGDVNAQFNKVKEDYIARAQKEFGADWDLALKDQTNPLGREFVNALDNFDHIAGDINQVTAKMAQIDADLQSGERVFSDETLNLRDDYLRLQNAFANGRIEGGQNMREMYDKLIGFTNLDEILTDQDFDIDGQVREIASLYEKDDIFGVNSVKRKEFEDQVRVIANGLAKGSMRNSVLKGHMTEDDIFNQILARHGSEFIQKKTASQKRKDSGGSTIIFDPNRLNDSPQTQKIGGFDSEAPLSYSVDTGAKRIDGSGLQTFDRDGNPVSLEGITDFKANELQVTKFTNPKTGKVEYKTSIVANVADTKVTEDGKTIKTSNDVLIDLDEPESRKRIALELFESQEDADAVFKQLDAKKQSLGEGSIPTTDAKSRIQKK